jgi:hypothetical protein
MRNGRWKILLTIHVGGLVLLGALSLTGRAAPPVKSARPTPLAKPSAIEFNRDIRPLLSENCFICHGPDANKRMAGLRLDVRENAITKGAIVPGRPDKSSLIARIFAKDSSPLRMPPLSAHKQLTAAQKDLLKRWIAGGAAYQKHWAFVPLPAQVSVPHVRNTAWARNPIDRFVLARLEQEKLTPSPEASRTDWLRRVTLDLIGLPPTLADIDAFLADTSPKAYEKVVDRLLASPHYGEQMAIPWLDVARYADSYGYQSDQLSPTWPYRDWVLKAFNENLSYDRFLTQQLAGDLMPNATRDTRLATAFNRVHRMTGEGGSVPEEWRMEGVADRVRTFGTAFLGLTLECARCHDHKYDPVSQRDFYGIAAFFNNIDEHGLYDRADIVPSPTLLLPTPEQSRAYSAAKEAVTKADLVVAAARRDGEAAFRAAIATKPPSPTTLPDLIGQFDFEAFEGENRTVLKNLVPGTTNQGTRVDEVPLVDGHTGKAAQLDGENNVNFPQIGRLFTRHTPFTLSFWIRDPRLIPEPVVVYTATSGTDAGPHGWDLMLDKGVLTARMYRHWPGNAIAVRAKEPIAKDAWTQVAVTYDGSSHAAGLRLYVNGRPVPIEIERDHLVKGIGQHTLAFGQRFRDKGFKGGLLDDLSIFKRDLSPIEIAHLYDGKSLTEALTHPEKNEAALREFYFSAVDTAARAATEARTMARAKVWQAEDVQYEIAVMEEMPTPRPSYVLARGQYDSPKSEKNRVGRIAPAAVMPYPASLRRDRLGLAQWLTRPDHPLTARVAVNRLWAQFFGRGLVETAEDFGIQGQLPTHPELLDWLARDFIGSGWNVKATVKKIVLSATYRQASAQRPGLRERDPENHLLARGPSYRLSAETIRDAALAACGLLDERLGGAPVSPYQPGDLWRENNTMSPAFRQSVGTDLYRRSLYTVVKRTAPMPNMLAFDAGSRETCIARRQATNTPLQAFVLLNDPQFVEAARVLAEKTLKEGGASDIERVRYAFRRLATREPNAEESRLLVALYAEQRAVFTKDTDAAAKLIKVGESKADASLTPAELAATTVVVQAILNLDATIWKR